MWKSVLIIVGIVLAVALCIFGLFVSTNNKAINLEEQIKSSKGDIEIQEKRRADLLVNLVDAIKSYNKFEQETLTKITEARSQAEGGSVDEAQLVIKAVLEAYPELKSADNYKQYMTETAITENLVAEYRKNYNKQVKSYNKFVRKFPTSVILNFMGYERIETEYTEYNASEDAPKNLFGD